MSYDTSDIGLEKAISNILKDQRLVRKALGDDANDLEPYLVPGVAKFLREGATADNIRVAVASLAPTDGSLKSVPGLESLMKTIRESRTQAQKSAAGRFQRNILGLPISEKTGKVETGNEARKNTRPRHQRTFEDSVMDVVRERKPA